MLSSADRIRNLLGRYGELIDAGDFDGVGTLFARGSLAAGDGAPFATGAEEVAAFYRSSTRLHPNQPATKHLVVGTVFEDPSPDGTVTARSSFLVLQAVEGALALQPIIVGRYRDRFACDADDGSIHRREGGGSERAGGGFGGDPGGGCGGGDGGWYFVERRFFVDLAGDLTHHLADPAIADLGSSGDR
jgi:hypothetical protein